MRRTESLLFALAGLALLSGCFGTPAGSVHQGDQVTIRYTVSDLETGEPLRENETASFAVGSGESGLGFTLESALRGHDQGDQFDVEVRRDAGLSYSERRSIPTALEAVPAVNNVSLADFEAYVGAPTLGQTFPFSFYQGVVSGFDAENVTYRIVAQDGQRNAVPSVGATLVTEVEGDMLQRRLEPMVGATFAIQPPSQLQPATPLGLDPGSYRVLGGDDEEIQLGYASSTAVDLLERPLRFEVTLVQVGAGSDEIPPLGKNAGERSSPQVLGDPQSVLAADASTST